MSTSSPRSAALLFAMLACGVGLIGCGSGSSTSGQSGQSHAGRHNSRVAGGKFPTSVVVTKVGELPAAVQDAASVALPGARMVLLGGLDATDNSTDAITIVHGATGLSAGTLPMPQHDAEAAQLGPDVYVFGGGEISSFDHILSYDPGTGSVSEAGQLPTPASDVAVTARGDTAYVVGGFDGANWLDSILAFRPGSAPQLVGHLPFGLRYAAVATAGARVVIAGGTTVSGLSDAILSFDPATGKVTQIGRLPVPLTHASAAWLAGRIWLVGGRRTVSGEQTSDILEIDPTSGAVRRIGRLPYHLSDAAVVPIGGRLIVAGGESDAGVQSSILALTPRLTDPAKAAVS